jgi:hypothetical protein
MYIYIRYGRETFRIYHLSYRKVPPGYYHDAFSEYLLLCLIIILSTTTELLLAKSLNFGTKFANNTPGSCRLGGVTMYLSMLCLVLIKDFGGVGILPALFWLRTPHPMY